LKRLGHDVATTIDKGNAGISMPDEAVLEFSTTSDRILVTMNRKHFIRLHNQGKPHQGIFVCKYDPDFARLARKIDDVLRKTTNLSGMLVRINRD
jgi:hypothetical protein